MRVSRRKFTAAVASLVVCGQVGCATLSGGKETSTNSESKKSLLERMPWAKDKDEAPEPYPNPVKIAATWTPDTLMQSGRTPTRGFGGRLFFYDERSRPVPVEGRLVVHGIDESAPSPEEGVKRFEFTPEQFTRHFSQTDLGASYSVWLPWDAVGGDQKRVSLVASFITSEGNTIQCVPSVVILPGRKLVADEAELLSRMSPQYQQHLDALATNANSSSGLTTTTIQRRQHSLGGRKPNVEARPFGSDASMIAGKSATPAADLQMRRPTRSPLIQPASAELPAATTPQTYRH